MIKQFQKKKAGRWVTELKKVYNRGFTPGFYFKRITEDDHQHNYPYNLSHYRYIRVGRIVSFDQQTGFVRISLNNGYISQDDDLIIMSKEIDTYIHQKAQDLKYEDRKVNKSPRDTKDNKILVDLKIKEPATGNGKDKVYIFTDKTYKRKVYSL